MKKEKNYQAINFLMEKDLKEDFYTTLNEMGLNLTSAFTMFAKEVVRRGKIPFDVMVDPFYRTENRNEIKRRIDGYESGRTKMIETTLEEIEELIHEND